MKKVKYNLFIIINYVLFIELCCPICFYENQHSNHKVLKIDDEESLKKENITIEASSNDFNEIIEKLKNLKDKIEKEIINLDESYDKVFNEVGKSYEKKHEKLILEEQKL